VTGARTGRSPKDKFTVDDAVTHDVVDWGKVNKPFAPEKFEALLARVLEHLQGARTVCAGPFLRSGQGLSVADSRGQ